MEDFVRELSEMNLTQVQERKASLEEEIRSAKSVDELNGMDERVEALNRRLEELEKMEARKASAKALAEGAKETKTVEKREEMKPMEEKKIYGVETSEYRSAFYAMIGGTATAEQRAILATPISVDGDGTNDGQAIAIPKTLDTKIWDNIHAAHPILDDITTVASGIVMEVTKHTGIANRVSAKKDGATTAGPEENTFVKVTLAGKDYEKYVELTYAEAKMSEGALEDYLAQEIADELGEALAKDTFAKILSDAGVGQKVTATSDVFADVKGALALASMANKPVIYAPASKYFDLVGAQDQNGQPVDVAGTFKCEVKRDDAATGIVVVDPKLYVNNLVQGVMIESAKDIKAHHVIVSGYMRAEGTLRKNKAAAYIA